MYEHVLARMRDSSARTLPASDLVERLAAVPGRTHTSFASKFCHFFVDAERFPIFDSYADWMVRLHLGRDIAREVTGHPYLCFLTNVRKLRERDGITCGTRKLDRYLWLAGQYRWWREKGERAQTNGGPLRRWSRDDGPSRALGSAWLAWLHS